MKIPSLISPLTFMSFQIRTTFIYFQNTRQKDIIALYYEQIEFRLLFINAHIRYIKGKFKNACLMCKNHTSWFLCYAAGLGFPKNQ